MLVRGSEEKDGFFDPHLHPLKPISMTIRSLLLLLRHKTTLLLPHWQHHPTLAWSWV
jgi:hypothetical protein